MVLVFDIDMTAWRSDSIERDKHSESMHRAHILIHHALLQGLHMRCTYGVGVSVASKLQCLAPSFSNTTSQLRKTTMRTMDVPIGWNEQSMSYSSHGRERAHPTPETYDNENANPGNQQRNQVVWKLNPPLYPMRGVTNAQISDATLIAFKQLHMSTPMGRRAKVHRQSDSHPFSCYTSEDPPTLLATELNQVIPILWHAVATGEQRLTKVRRINLDGCGHQDPCAEDEGNEQRADLQAQCAEPERYGFSQSIECKGTLFAECHDQREYRGSLFEPHLESRR